MNAPGLALAELAPGLGALAAGLAAPLAGAWLEAVVRASLQGGLAAAALWLLCRLVPRLPPALTAALWWTVCLKLVVALAWGWPVAAAVPATPVDRAKSAAVGQGTAGETAGFAAEPIASTLGGAPGRDAPVAAPSGREGDAPGAPFERPVSTVSTAIGSLGRLEAALVDAVPRAARPLLLLAWLLGLALVLAASSRRRRRLRDAIAAAEPVTDPEPRALVARLAGRVGIRAPRLLASDRVASPLVAGPFRPKIVVPRRALAGPAEDLEMLLLHELVHLRRRDLALGLVPALAGRLLYFHPLAALAVREHLVAREAACDAEVVRRLDAAPRAYGRLLLRWGVVQPAARPAAAVAAHDRNHLKRRLLMLAQTAPKTAAPSRRSRAWLAAAALPAAALLLPIRWVADGEAAPTPPPVGESTVVAAAPAAPEVRAVQPPSQPAPPAPPAEPTVQPAPRPQPAAVVAWAVQAAPHPAPAPAPAPPAPPAPASAYAVAPGPSGSTSSVQIGWGGHGHGYAVLHEDGYSTFGGGSWSADRARELRRSPREPLFLFRRDDETYVVRDPELVARAVEATRPIRELGERQGLLGGEQGELGGRQGELGGEQGDLGARQGELGGEMGRLGGRLGALVAEKARLEARRAVPGAAADAATLERIAELEREIEGIESQMQALGERMRELGEQQRELGERQRALGETQRELGERQRALGMRQRELAGRAQEQLTALADRALEAGKAERVD